MTRLPFQVTNKDGTTSLDRQTSVETITITFTRNIE